MLLPSQGRETGGVRNSRLLINSASPPSGDPVAGSRGPAWLMEKPRRVLPPPERNRSGSGMSWLVPNWFSTPTVVERAKTHLFLLRLGPKGKKIAFCASKRLKLDR